LLVYKRVAYIQGGVHVSSKPKIVLSYAQL
jgi:hypothetical protein